LYPDVHSEKPEERIWDIKNIRTPSSLSNPHQYSQGVIHLMINGEPVIAGGKWTGKLPGKVLKPK
jgi:N-acyl-D-amino-acid deacylase